MIINSTLRQSVAAAAGTHLFIKLVKRSGALAGRKFREIHAREFGGAVGVLNKNLSHILKSFHANISNRQTEDGTNFCFI